MKFLSAIRAFFARLASALDSMACPIVNARRPVVEVLESRMLLSASPLAAYKLDEASGPTTADSMGAGPIGTLHGGVSRKGRLGSQFRWGRLCRHAAKLDARS